MPRTRTPERKHPHYTESVSQLMSKPHIHLASSGRGCDGARDWLRQFLCEVASQWRSSSQAAGGRHHVRLMPAPRKGLRGHGATKTFVFITLWTSRTHGTPIATLLPITRELFCRKGEWSTSVNRCNGDR